MDQSGDIEIVKRVPHLSNREKGSEPSFQEYPLDEYESLTGVALTAAEAQAFQAYHPKVEVHPSLSGGYDIQATSWIGAVTAGRVTLRIRPKIDIGRVLFLVSYALDPKGWLEKQSEFGRRDTLLEAMAPGFLALVRRTLTRGLLRGYRSREEALRTIRGRLRFDDQIRRRFGRFPPAEVTYDEFTEDIEENRLLLAALERLGRLRPRELRIRRGIRRLKARLQRVSLIDYSRRPLPRISFTRLNEHYRASLNLAELILRNSSIAHESGPIQSSAFLLNMNQVFEDFVVIALRDSLGLSARRFPQECAGRDLRLDSERRVRLEPDLSWWRDSRAVFVGDVKYKKLKDKKARNADLYQLLAYLTATDLSVGMLVYAERKSSATVYHVAQGRKQLEVRGLNLGQDPEGILDEVNVLANRIRALADPGMNDRMPRIRHRIINRRAT